MIDSATASTMTMAVAADNPPMKAASATHFASAPSGSVNMKKSGSAAPGRRSIRPAAAIGTTKILIANR